MNLSYMSGQEVICEACGGGRYSEEALAHTYNGKNIAEVLAMPAAEAVAFFEGTGAAKKLGAVAEVGLSYLAIGQPLSTLSGGESQRLKLAKELLKKGGLYILDEPTTGLHRSDEANLLAIIDKLVDAGNTVMAIEHNLNFIKHADYIIDMGPESGAAGGEILYEGPLLGLLECETSHTAKYLKQSLPQP